MNTFVDPRVETEAPLDRPRPRTTTHAEELAELNALCSAGRLYDIERWIDVGRPLQADAAMHRRRASSALQIALEAGNHSLVLLLLSNGYDANREPSSPLDLALRDRRFDLVTLLLDWGAEPRDVDLDDLFDTYNSGLFERFRQSGVDLTAGHALAGAMAYHTSNKPLLGFVKRHRTSEPKFQKELDIALAHHAGEGNEKGVQLCLWAGADPHTPVPSLRFSSSRPASVGESGGDELDLASTAIYEACRAGRHEILQRLGPDPVRDDFEELWRAASDRSVIDILAQHGLPKNVGQVIEHHLWWTTFGDPWRRLETLRHLFRIGARWEEAGSDEIGRIRRSLLKASDSTFVEVMKTLAMEEHCSGRILIELARTPSMLARMKKVGFIPSQDASDRYGQLRPTHSREVVKRFGIQQLKVRQAKTLASRVPRSITIGRHAGKPVELSREQLYELVWSKPVDVIAKEHGLSGRGLKKICARSGVPVPPRGYWAKLSAGKRVTRPRLPTLPTIPVL
jgi:hypothetical protein